MKKQITQSIVGIIALLFLFVAVQVQAQSVTLTFTGKDANNNWVEVEEHSPFTVKKDCYNSVDFKPVRTKGLKILAKLQQGQSGGVLEWKVNGK